MSTNLKYLIIGGGITGITIARLLQMASENSFLILEKENEPGGLCRTRETGGHFLDTGGGHFLYSRHQEVYDFIFSHIGKDQFNRFDRVSKIRLHGNTIDYPIESNIWQLPQPRMEEYLQSVLNAGQILRQQEPSNFLEWISWKLGESIAKDYMVPYNSKIWGCEPSALDIDWLHKIPQMDVASIQDACREKSLGTNFFPSHAHFYYPKTGGFQRVFDSIYAYVSEQVQTDTPVYSIERQNDHWLVNGTIRTTTVINTAPWTALQSQLRPPSGLDSAFEKLRHSSIVVSLYEKPYQHNHHWVYIPNPRVKHHREFYIHNFAPHSKPGGIYLETNLQRWDASEQFESQTALEHHLNEYAYPIPVKSHAESIRQILDYYSKMSFHGVGRWGQWNYFNSDKCILEAMKFLRDTLRLDHPFQ